MHYAVCWLNENRRIAGWSIHADPESASRFTVAELGEKNVSERATPVYEVTVSKNDFEEDMFMAMLCGGFIYFDEENPSWLHGSTSSSSKCYNTKN